MNTVTYQGQLGNGPSPDLWHDCPVLELLEDPGKGLYGFDDFSRMPTLTSGSGALDSGLYGYDAYTDEGAIAGPAGLQGAGLLISANDADNDEAHIQASGGGLVISDTASVARKLWFECRLKKASVTDNALAFFVGLCQVPLATNMLVDNTGAMVASKSYLGFRVLQDNGEELDIIYGDSAGSVQEWAAAITSMVADTYIKLGFKYDPDHPTRKIRFWLDGVEYKTDYIDAADIAAATFPDGDVLAPTLLTKVGTAAESKLYMPWWRWAQLAV